MTATPTTPFRAATGPAPTVVPRPRPPYERQGGPAPQPRRQAETQPRRQREVAPAVRPDLRLVDPSDERRRRRIRLATWVLVVLAGAGLFAIVALRVMLAQGQGEVDRLQASVGSETTTQQQLRVQVAALEAPAQVVAAARSRLGMVNPAAVTYLSPVPPAPAR